MHTVTDSYNVHVQCLFQLRLATCSTSVRRPSLITTLNVSTSVSSLIHSETVTIICVAGMVRQCVHHIVLSLRTCRHASAGR